jgi:hypothetical protein
MTRNRNIGFFSMIAASLLAAAVLVALLVGGEISGPKVAFNGSPPLNRIRGSLGFERPKPFLKGCCAFFSNRMCCLGSAYHFGGSYGGAPIPIRSVSLASGNYPTSRFRMSVAI